ncbi:S-adenosylmethionine:tRNA ribosyltransferase-isomerase [Nocardioides sp. JQ2195]|uniref:S-adenosylmethionine:tRNA ribosyltransferase-isomerase n=1 Tax=Nocardioides sp. JQ2195 TaxID=2592334 RepID=UPI00143EED35|nr:S-adenosylmethionine:tRNA ribosyltransferase-isomerase [Nocardioides sp. JQ2195]QIX28091.1 S-adenosylmethionine:tRNA ribosyltransferase-isomerase [Nocardioides sp. JQ2195]
MTALRDQPLTRFPTPTTAPAPAEARGLRRDEVRLLVARPDGVTHVAFHELPEHLAPGDLLVVNDSATVPGEIDTVSDRLGPVVLHVGSVLDDGTRLVELRSAPDAAEVILGARVGDVLRCGSAELELVSAHAGDDSSPTGLGNRLWRARPTDDLDAELVANGRPVAYGHLHHRYPLADYQTIFGSRPGSAEMPSAGRPFSERVLTRLVARGVLVATVTLHTGLSSQELGESPATEWFEVSESTADLVNATRRRGGRVVAVGTTVTRALESAVDTGGRVVAASGWTDRVISPQAPARVVDGLVTGWHDPRASHLLLVESVAGAELTQTAYDEAWSAGYLWHEFGDSALLLP